MHPERRPRTPVAIVGASGQLGTALRDVYVDTPPLAPTHAELPLEDAAALATYLDAHRPAALINCAAFHQVDVCEREPERAFAINALAVDRAAGACAARGIPFVTVSTDYVFSGESDRPYVEGDEARPRTAYGIAKLAGEQLTRRHGGPHLIVRTAGVFGTTGTSNKGYTLIEKVLGQAERGEPTRMVSDMTLSPAYAPDLARTIRALLDAQAWGTHHVTNAGAVTWFDFVRTAFVKAGFADAPLEGVPYAAQGNPTPRPRYSALANTTLAPLGIAPPPRWDVALDAFLAQRAARMAQA